MTAPVRWCPTSSRQISTVLLAAACVTLLTLVVRRTSWPGEMVFLLQPQYSPAEEMMMADIRRNYLKPPSFHPYNLKDTVVKDPSRGQTKVILKALQNMVLSKNRNAWSVNVCLNSKNAKSQVKFKQAFNIGKIASGDSARGTVAVDCFPLHALLFSLNVTRVDYFSLDVEGAELDVLHTVPFDRLDIRTLSVEFAHTTGGGKPALRSFMEAKGYTVIAEVTQSDWTANDFIFVKNTAFPELARQFGHKDKQT